MPLLKASSVERFSRRLDSPTEGGLFAVWAFGKAYRERGWERVRGSDGVEGGVGLGG